MNSLSPAINVVTVTYNCRALIKRTLESYLAQGYLHKRIIVIDGGSTDGTLEIIRAYGDRLDVVISEPDKGIYDAMNKALPWLNPGLVNYLNAGDVYASDDVLSQVANVAVEDTGLIWGDLLRYDDAGNSWPLSQKHGLSARGKIHQICHQSAFMRVDPQLLFYDLEWRLCADFRTLLRFWFSNFQCQYIAVPVVKYLNGGLSDKRVQQLVQEKRDIIHKYWPRRLEAKINCLYLNFLHSRLKKKDA